MTVIAMDAEPEEGPLEFLSGRRYYDVVRKLGAGGMAEVYLCMMQGGEGFSRPVALKLINDEYAAHAAFRRQFTQEARFASMLSHSNIVNVIDFDMDSRGRLFLVMEYVEGVDLHALTSGRVLPPSIAIHIAAGILGGLGYAHTLPHGGDVRGIVHRDISPQNILLSWSGAVKVADFGIAKALTTSGVLSGFKGKAAYMSPEQAAGDPIDGRSDLFSVGVVLWEMLTGRRLFQGQQVREVISRIMLGDIPAPSIIRPVAPDLERVVMQLLANDREARYATAREAAAGLMQCQDAPKNGPSELVAYLAKRFPPGSQHAQRAPEGTSASGLPSSGPITITAPEGDISNEGTEAQAHAATPGNLEAQAQGAALVDLEPLTRASPITASQNSIAAHHSGSAAGPRAAPRRSVALAVAVALALAAAILAVSICLSGAHAFL